MVCPCSKFIAFTWSIFLVANDVPMTGSFLGRVLFRTVAIQPQTHLRLPLIIDHPFGVQIRKLRLDASP
jgi:hypothetical protein